MKFFDNTKIPSHSPIIQYNFTISSEQVKLYRDDCSVTRAISRLLHNDERSIERRKKIFIVHPSLKVKLSDR